MRDAQSYPSEMPETLAGSQVMANPTLRENIETKIQYYKDEIARLEKVKIKMEFMLDVNLRDLREAMNV